MPLVLPFLRLLLLFVNVYETFKTLRPPRGSSRSSQLSVRAVSQRKRDMKGCMTVWLLWVSTWVPTYYRYGLSSVLRFSVLLYHVREKLRSCPRICGTILQRNEVYGLLVPVDRKSKSKSFGNVLLTRPNYARREQNLFICMSSVPSSNHMLQLWM